MDRRGQFFSIAGKLVVYSREFLKKKIVDATTMSVAKSFKNAPETRAKIIPALARGHIVVEDLNDGNKSARCVCLILSATTSCDMALGAFVVWNG